jgi:hypothetical protein
MKICLDFFMTLPLFIDLLSNSERLLYTNKPSKTLEFFSNHKCRQLNVCCGAQKTRESSTGAFIQVK